MVRRGTRLGRKQKYKSKEKSFPTLKSFSGAHATVASGFGFVVGKIEKLFDLIWPRARRLSSLVSEMKASGKGAISPCEGQTFSCIRCRALARSNKWLHGWCWVTKLSATKNTEKIYETFMPAGLTWSHLPLIIHRFSRRFEIVLGIFPTNKKLFLSVRSDQDVYLHSRLEARRRINHLERFSLPP